MLIDHGALDFTMHTIGMCINEWNQPELLGK